eukprot:TRINITY_DN13669_c0_g1_i1.p1 TRINITY_DN13669_c0_g1~~TRINITY_DN13669_c0_g1_i1.p1  ORF type:complete len:151 (-),score=4.95 TRINITY_DN13669_c0_g1_i1:38-490(-)
MCIRDSYYRTRYIAENHVLHHNMNINRIVILCLLFGAAVCGEFKWDVVTAKRQSFDEHNFAIFHSADGDVHLFWSAQEVSSKTRVIYQRMSSRGSIKVEKVLVEFEKQGNYVSEYIPVQVSNDGAHLVFIYRDKITVSYTHLTLPTICSV